MLIKETRSADMERDNKVTVLIDGRSRPEGSIRLIGRIWKGRCERHAD